MKALAAALLVFVAACGQGKAIFNVEVYSFMAGSGKDTIPYAIPPSSSASASTFQRILLPPGFGGSIVDSVRITTGNANLINNAGTGTIGLQFRFAADSAGTIAASKSVSGHGLSVQVPSRWTGVVYQRAGGLPILHAASFRLPPIRRERSRRPRHSISLQRQ